MFFSFRFLGHCSNVRIVLLFKFINNFKDYDLFESASSLNLYCYSKSKLTFGGTHMEKIEYRVVPGNIYRMFHEYLPPQILKFKSLKTLFCSQFVLNSFINRVRRQNPNKIQIKQRGRDWC